MMFRTTLRHLHLLSTLSLLAGCAASTGDATDSESAAVTTCGSALGNAVATAAAAGQSTITGTLETKANAIIGGPYVQGAAIGNEIVNLVSSAKSEVFVQVFDIQTGSWLAEQLETAIARLPSTVKVFIMANPETGGSGSGALLSLIPETRAHCVSRLQALYPQSNVTVGCWNTGWDPLDVDHVKTIVVDNSRALVMDANLQDNSDPVGTESSALGWFQLGFLVEGAVASQIRQDSIVAWQTTYPSQALPAAPTAPVVAACTRTVLLGRNAGAGDTSSADKGYAALLGGAAKTLHVWTPNLNYSDALTAIANATATAQVEIILSQGFNDTEEGLPGEGGTNETVVSELGTMAKNPCNLHIRWFARTAGVAENGNTVSTSHVKWASADGTAMILGSQNLDTQSWDYSREVSVLVDDPATTASFDAVFATEWALGAPAFECSSK